MVFHLDPFLVRGCRSYVKVQGQRMKNFFSAKSESEIRKKTPSDGALRAEMAARG